MTPASKTICFATSFDEAEGPSNAGLGCVHKMFPAAAAATNATSIGSGDRAENEQDYLQQALTLLTKMHAEEESFETVTVQIR